MKHLYIAAPTYDRTVALGYCQSLVQTAVLCAQHKIGITTDYKPGPYIHQNRNWLVHRFLQSNADAMMFIDVDVRWPAQAVVDLYNSNHPVVGGAYPVKEPDERYPVQLLAGGKEGYRHAAYVPGGFMLIRRYVFELLQHHVPAYKDQHSGGEKVHAYFQNIISSPDAQETGEDVEFCNRWRVFGHVWCKPDIDFGHQGAYEWEGNLHKSILPLYEVA